MNPTFTNTDLPESELVVIRWNHDSQSSDTPARWDAATQRPETPTHPPQVLLKWLPEQRSVSPLRHSFYARAGKRIIDMVISLLVIVFILSWVMPILSALILRDSSGPLFFVQRRSGRRGRPFFCLKFRSMYHRKQAGFQQTTQNDSRITKVGQFLRKTNLDELPQFFNVLLGDMSLVGPRPHAILHDAQHWHSAAYRERYWVRPGITGLAQVRGSRGETQEFRRMDHRIRYDHLYIRRQTLGLDLKICLSTLNLMAKGDMNAW